MRAKLQAHNLGSTANHMLTTECVLLNTVYIVSN